MPNLYLTALDASVKGANHQNFAKTFHTDKLQCWGYRTVKEV